MKRLKLCMVIFFCLMMMFSIQSCSKSENTAVAEENANFTQDQINTLKSIKKIDDHPLYVMTYYGDYGFKDYLKVGEKVAANKKPLTNACTCLTAFAGKDGPVFGRNLDWHDCPALVVYTTPPDGYASVSIVDIRYYDFTTDMDITKMSLKERERLLRAPFLPFDGMNEWGLCVGEMLVYGTKPPYDPNKVSIDTGGALRLMLDYAKNVDEAIELLKKYNIVFLDPAPPQHYLVADPSGKSAVIEFVDGEIKVTYNTKPYQVSTNFMIYGSDKNDWDACSRYKRATEVLENAKGCVSQKEAMDIMKEVSVTSTQWSVVYNMKSGDIDIVMGGELKKIMDGDYGKTRSLKLKMRN